MCFEMGVFNELESELKRLIVLTLELEDLTPEEINSEDPLFGDGLGLDTIDALELGLALQKTYGLCLAPNLAGTASPFYSVAKLAETVARHQTC